MSEQMIFPATACGLDVPHPVLEEHIWAEWVWSSERRYVEGAMRNWPLRALHLSWRDVASTSATCHFPSPFYALPSRPLSSRVKSFPQVVSSFLALLSGSHLVPPLKESFSYPPLAKVGSPGLHRHYLQYVSPSVLCHSHLLNEWMC